MSQWVILKLMHALEALWQQTFLNLEIMDSQVQLSSKQRVPFPDLLYIRKIKHEYNLSN